MAHYARIVDDIVQQVIVADEDYISTLEGTWIKASYNMRGGVYIDNATNAPAKDQSVINDDEARQRKNFPLPGYSYDGTGFFAPKPYASWVLDSTSYLWEAPIPKPDDDKTNGGEKEYGWDEDSKSWVEIEVVLNEPYPDDGKEYDWDEDSESWVEIDT